MKAIFIVHTLEVNYHINLVVGIEVSKHALAITHNYFDGVMSSE